MDAGAPNPISVPAVIPPGGALPAQPEPLDGVSAQAIRRITADYVDGSKKVDDIAMDLGLTTREVRMVIKTYGLEQRKRDIIAQVQQEELAAYSKFLLDNRVDTAKTHLSISNKLNKAVNSVLDHAVAMSPDELEAKVKSLKSIASLYKSLAETFMLSSGVGAKAVSLSGLDLAQVAPAAAGGRPPLVQNNFTVVVPPGEKRAPVLEAEVVREGDPE